MHPAKRWEGTFVTSQSKPTPDTLFNRRKLCWGQTAEFAERQFGWDGNQALNNKSALFEERNINCHFNFGTTERRRV